MPMTASIRPAGTNRVRMRFPALEDNVAVARAAAAALASQLPFSLSELEELRIAVSEAVTNAVLHAYPPGTQGEVELLLAIDPDAERMDVEVRDEGTGIFDLDRARRPEVSTLEGHLGLGFAFMESMSDTLSVESGPGRGTVVRFAKCPVRARQDLSEPGS